MATTAVVVPQPLTPEVIANLRAGARLGIHYVPLTNTAALPVAIIAAARAAAREDGGWPYPIPAGGSSPLGTLGYVAAALELRDQVREGRLPQPTYAVCPAGSGGTLAGLTLGLRLAGLATRAVGVTVYHRGATNQATTALLANRALALLRRAGGAQTDRPRTADPPLGWLRPSDVTVLQGYRGPGYAVPTEACQRAVAWARDHAGLRLETTYSGKAFAAALDLAGQLRRGESVLFLHTFGPAPNPSPAR